MSSNCFSKSSITFEIFSTSMDFRAAPMPFVTLPMALDMSFVRIAVSSRCATASIREPILR